MIETVLRLARVDEKPALRRMLDDYLAELAPMGEFDASYPYFDLYWQEPERKAYWIESASEAVGFIFINRRSFSGQPIDWALAEIYIIPSHRTSGVARQAMRQLFAANPGWWEGCVFNDNMTSLAFCRSVLAKLGAYEEIAIPGKIIFRISIDA